MYTPLSANFSRRVRESGKRKTVADVYYDNALIATDLAVSEGSIKVDLDGQVRRSGSVTIADPRLVPSFSKVLSPQGAEIVIRQGVVYPNGTEELIPLGRFHAELASWRELENISTIQLYDRSKGLASSKLSGLLSRSGKSATEVIIEILEWYYPELAPLDPVAVFAEGLAFYRLPGGQVFDQGNYWDAISDLARNMGGRLYFDVEGQPKVSLIDNLSSISNPVLTIDSGELGILEEAEHSLSSEEIFNAVTVVGATPENGVAVSATVYNLDPSSPLRYGGPFGKRIDSITDSALTELSQCYRRANLELAKYTGLSYSTDFTAVPNPALDVDDFVRFRYPSGRTEVHQIQSLSIPLGSGKFSGTTRGAYLNG